jgi:hypothetical protein
MPVGGEEGRVGWDGGAGGEHGGKYSDLIWAGAASSVSRRGYRSEVSHPFHDDAVEWMGHGRICF